jgi:hypothetical protein
MSKPLIIVSGNFAGKPNRGGLVGAQHTMVRCVPIMLHKGFSHLFSIRRITFLERGRLHFKKRKIVLIYDP